MNRVFTRLGFTAAAIVAGSGIVAHAQTATTGAVSGAVTDGKGAPVAGATIRLTSAQTTRQAVTGADGSFRLGLLNPGAWTIEVTKSGLQKFTQNLNVLVNQTQPVNIKMAAEAATVVEVLGTTATVDTTTTQTGLVTSMDNLSAIPKGRDMSTVAMLAPGVVTGGMPGSNDPSIGGGSAAENSYVVDGLSTTNTARGYQGASLVTDFIDQVEVQTGGFKPEFSALGGVINAITKSGTNSFKGSAWATWDAIGIQAMPKKNDYFKQTPPSSRYDLGAEVSGPIIKDKLFFFAGYEDQKVTGIQGVGTDAVSTGDLTQAQVDAVAQAFNSIGIDPGTNGGGGAGLTQEDKRSLAKLDWNINDSQRASFTYQRTEENRPTPYSAYVKPSSVILSSDFYTVSSKTNNYSFQLFSDWTDTFSTEFKLGYQKYDNTNGAAKNQPEVYACFTATAANCPNYAGSIPSSVDWVIAGEDRFRHENSIASKRLNGTLAGTWHLGDHVVKAGFDYLSNKTADVFGQLLHGSYGFYDKNGNGTPADEIAAGNYGTYVVNILPTGVTLADSAGTWKYTQISPFLQDTWQATDRLSLTYGVRIDMPDSDHAPPVAIDPATGKSYWEERFGYAPNTALGSKNSVIEPRIAFNYNFDTALRMQLHGGVGLFQSLPPTVWLSNPYINNGVVGTKQFRSSDPTTYPFSPDPYNQPGPGSLQSGICTASANCQIDTLDPNFKLPTSLKFNLAFDSELPWWGLVGSAEYMMIKSDDAIAYLAPNFGVPNGKLPDGRNSYWKTAVTSGTGTNFGAYPEFNTRSTELTNTSQGMSNSITLALSKPFDNGLSGTVSATFAHATDINPGTSSQAYSNFNYNARIDPNDIVAAPSRFNIPLTFKAALNWDHAFFGDNKTTASLFYSGHSGLPYSWIFGSDVNGDSLSNDDLAYIPLKNDPRVSYGSATQAQIDAFNSYIDSNSYLSKHRGQIAARNASNSPWVNQLDLGLQQELPGFFGKDKFVVRMDIYNFLNLLNKKWGDVDNAGFFGTRYLVSSASVANGQYTYNLSKPPQDYTLYDSYTNPSRVVSRWQILLTLRYKF